MKIFKTIITCTTLVISAGLYADTATHSHNGRTHTHPLPAQGIQHKHGNGAVGIKSKATSQQQVNVYALQRKLKKLGLYSGPINGVVTNETRVALKKYMESNRGSNNRSNATGNKPHSGGNETWNKISIEKLFNVISGNTLTLDHEKFCKERTSNKKCTKISILENQEKAVSAINRGENFYGYGSYEAKRTTINVDKKKIITGIWGRTAINAFGYGLITGLISIPEEAFSEGQVFVNSRKDIIKIESDNEKKPQSIYIHVKKGHDNIAIKHAKNGQYAQIASSDKTFGQVLLGKVVTGTMKTLQDAASSSSVATPSNYCFGSGLSEGNKNLCLALSKRESSYCFGSGLNEGMKNLCLGVSKRESSYCFASAVSESNKNLCLALSKREPNYCFGSGLSEGMKNLCLGGSKRDSNYCFASGLSEGYKNLCLAISK